MIALYRAVKDGVFIIRTTAIIAEHFLLCATAGCLSARHGITFYMLITFSFPLVRRS